MRHEVIPAERSGLVKKSDRTRQRWSVSSRELSYYLFVLPAVLILVLVNLLPLFNSLFISLTDYSLMKPADWDFIGFRNYAKALTDQMVLNSLFNTVKFTLLATGLEFSIGLCIALLINRLNRLANLVLALLMLPMMLTPIIIGLQWRFLLNHTTGLVNYFLDAIGIGRFSFLADPKLALPAVILADVWQWTPFVILLLYSGLQALPREPFEAASIDGANEFEKFRYITLPALQNTILIVVLIRAMDALREYDKIFTMTYGGPGSATETMSFHIYLQGFKLFSTGYAAAISYLLLIITIVIIQLTWNVLRRGS